LEYAVKNKISNSAVVFNTLLELNIQETSAQPSNKMKESATLEFMSVYSSNYDINQALVVCQLYNFAAGLLFLYEKNGMFNRILQHHMDNKDYDAILKTCLKYDSQDLNIWTNALKYFSKQEDIRCKEYLIQTLSAVEKYNLLPPIIVIKTISQNSTITFDTIKDYLVNRLKKEEKEIENDQETVNKYHKVSMDMKNKINQLQFSPLIFQANKCEYCGSELDFPSVHCLCSHSFHAECFENHSIDDRCPTCTIENSNWISLINQTQESKENLHESFHKQLERTNDKFEVIAEFLGKGLFNKMSLMSMK